MTILLNPEYVVSPYQDGLRISFDTLKVQGIAKEQLSLIVNQFNMSNRNVRAVIKPNGMIKLQKAYAELNLFIFLDTVVFGMYEAGTWFDTEVKVQLSKTDLTKKIEALELPIKKERVQSVVDAYRATVINTVSPNHRKGLYYRVKPDVQSVEEHNVFKQPDGIVII